MLDILGELGSAPAWFYRGWAFLFSKSYRQSLKIEYRKMSLFFKFFDFLFSLIFFIGEIGFIIYLGFAVMYGAS